MFIYKENTGTVISQITSVFLFFINFSYFRFLYFLDHENGVRSDSPPTQTLKSSFRPIHDR